MFAATYFLDHPKKYQILICLIAKEFNGMTYPKTFKLSEQFRTYTPVITCYCTHQGNIWVK